MNFEKSFSINLEHPKSHTLKSPSSVTKIFAGFKSLCIIDFEFNYKNAKVVCISNLTIY
jgi:hypothetical protein